MNKNIYFIPVFLIFLIGIVSAANTITLVTPAQSASVSGSYLINATYGLINWYTLYNNQKELRVE